MAIQDRSITELQSRLVRSFGNEILLLNGADQLFISVNGYVTGSDVLNVNRAGDTVWRSYHVANEISQGFEFAPRTYLRLVSSLGIVGRAEIVEFSKKKFLIL